MNGLIGEIKLKLMKDIVVEYNVDWDLVFFEREIRVDYDDVFVSVYFFDIVVIV